MSVPQHLMFVRKVEVVVPMPVSVLREQLIAFKPSLQAQHKMTIRDDQFVLRYGSDAQMKIWMIGTLTSLDDINTELKAQIGIDRYQSNLKYVVGLSGIVAMMALAEALDNDLELGHVLEIGLLFVFGFWILVLVGMIYSQHRIYRDVIQLLSAK